MEELIVYCNGLSFNGLSFGQEIYHGDLTGIGIYVTKGNVYNTCARLMPDGFIQSTYVAKFVSVIYALQIIPDDRPLRIITDSTYVLQADSWYEIWTKRQTPADMESIELHRIFENLINARRQRVTFALIPSSRDPMYHSYYKSTKKAMIGATRNTHLIMGLGDGLTLEQTSTVTSSSSSDCTN
jgi:ribonuclease HI